MTRLSAFGLLALANLLWSGNWIAGRALREAFDPVTLNFMRWVIAVALLAPFVLPGLRAKAGLLRRHAGILFVLSLTGVALFHSLVYLGLRTTTAVNAILLNSSIPLFILLVSWVLERERASARQIAGMSCTGATPGCCSPCRCGGSTRCSSSGARPSSAAWNSCS
jgi:drug/metabolite transporter (DMT)-like permease